MKKDKSENKMNVIAQSAFSQTFFHGTKADLKFGDLIEVGLNSNYGQNNKAKYIYLTATLDAAIWGAELALGEGRERIYLVEPTGSVENDPNLTDKKFPGNPTMSYRSKYPFKVVGEMEIGDEGDKLLLPCMLWDAATAPSQNEIEHVPAEPMGKQA